MISESKDVQLVRPNIFTVFSNTYCILLNSLAYIFSLQQKIIFIQSITIEIRQQPSISSPSTSIGSKIIDLIFTVRDEVDYDGPCEPLN